MRGNAEAGEGGGVVRGIERVEYKRQPSEISGRCGSLRQRADGTGRRDRARVTDCNDDRK